MDFRFIRTGRGTYKATERESCSEVTKDADFATDGRQNSEENKARPQQFVAFRNPMVQTTPVCSPAVPRLISQTTNGANEASDFSFKPKSSVLSKLLREIKPASDSTFQQRIPSKDEKMAKDFEAKALSLKEELTTLVSNANAINGGLSEAEAETEGAECLRVALGNANILLQKRLPQFLTLVHRNLNNEVESAQPVKLCDLDALWSLISDMRSKLMLEYETAGKWQVNNWTKPISTSIIEELPQVRSRSKLEKVQKVEKTEAQERRRKMLAEAKCRGLQRKAASEVASSDLI